jgi:PGF-CTERM protein
LLFLSFVPLRSLRVFESSQKIIKSVLKSEPPGGDDDSGGGTYPLGWFRTPTVTPPDEAVTTPTKPVADEEVIPDEAEVTPTRKKPWWKIPGFTAVFAIAGLLAVAYVLMRRRD